MGECDLLMLHPYYHQIVLMSTLLRLVTAAPELSCQEALGSLIELATRFQIALMKEFATMPTCHKKSLPKINHLLGVRAGRLPDVSSREFWA